MDFCGSTTRKYTTALTFTETLSREITSWLGTSITTIRRSTRCICCTSGTRMISPGPRTPEKRPSVNTTPRPYSRRLAGPQRRRGGGGPALAMHEHHALAAGPGEHAAARADHRVAAAGHRPPPRPPDRHHRREQQRP